MLKPSLLFISFVLVCILPAQLNDERPISLEDKIKNYDGKIISRPNTASAQFDAKIVEYVIDGFSGKNLILESDLISLNTFPLTNWQQKKANSSNYSAVYSNRHIPNLIITYTVFSKNIFLLTEHADSMIAYLAGLQKTYKDRFIINTMPNEFREHGYNSYLLQKPTFFIDYSIKPRHANLPTIRYFSYLISADNTWIEISIQGPKEILEAQLPSFKRSLRSTAIIE